MQGEGECCGRRKRCDVRVERRVEGEARGPVLRDEGSVVVRREDVVWEEKI